MLGKLANVAVWLLLAISLIIIGWDEPIRYKFMTREQVAEAESVYRPIRLTPRKPDFRDWPRRANPLDEKPKSTIGGMRR